MEQEAPLRIFVDADSFPREARTVLERTAVRTGVQLVYAANHDVPFYSQSPLFRMVVCPQSEGAADDYIMESATENDIVATRDIPLAGRLVHRGITVLNDRGLVFDRKNVSEMLEERELKLRIQALGIAPKGKFRSYGKKESSAFAVTLDRTVTQMLRKSRGL